MTDENRPKNPEEVVSPDEAPDGTSDGTVEGTTGEPAGDTTGTALVEVEIVAEPSHGEESVEDEGAGSASIETDEGPLEQNNNLENIVMALLFSADEPVSIRKLASIVEDASGDQIKLALNAIAKKLDGDSMSIALERVAGGYQLASRPDYAVYIARLYSGKRKFRLSKAGLEALAIIAYKQPITRAEIENVRGVGSGGVVTNLMERSLVKITGKAKILGAPFLYGTTTEFLEYLGLNSLKDLPSMEELEALLEKEAYPESASADDEVEVATPKTTVEGGADTTSELEIELSEFDDEIAPDGDSAPEAHPVGSAAMLAAEFEASLNPAGKPAENSASQDSAVSEPIDADVDSEKPDVGKRVDSDDETENAQSKEHDQS